jgi:hypothetical protein
VRSVLNAMRDHVAHRSLVVRIQHGGVLAQIDPVEAVFSVSWLRDLNPIERRRVIVPCQCS